MTNLFQRKWVVILLCAAGALGVFLVVAKPVVTVCEGTNCPVRPAQPTQRL